MDRKTGARGLRAIVESILLEPMFEIPGSDVTAVHINEEVVSGNHMPIYTRTLNMDTTATADGPKSSSPTPPEEVMLEVNTRA